MAAIIVENEMKEKEYLRNEISHLRQIVIDFNRILGAILVEHGGKISIRADQFKQSWNGKIVRTDNHRDMTIDFELKEE